MWGPTQNLGPIGSAVLMFIGYKQTDTQTEKQIYTYRSIFRMYNFYFMKKYLNPVNPAMIEQNQQKNLNMYFQWIRQLNHGIVSSKMNVVLYWSVSKEVVALYKIINVFMK